MRRRVRVLLALVAPCASAAFAPAWAPAESLTIGAWNIEHCGEPGYPKDPQALADYIAASGVRLLALEEIMITHRDANGLYRNRTLDETVAKLGPTWRYVVFNTSCSAPILCLGVLFDTSAVQPRLYTKLPTPTDMYLEHRETGGVVRHPVLCRGPVAVWFQAGRGKTDFVLVPLHLKSNTLHDPHPEDRVNHRKAEAEQLLAALAKVLPQIDNGRERDIYLAGDTNILHHADADMGVFLQAHYIDMNAADHPTYVGTGAPFDRFIVAAASTEVRGQSFHVQREYLARHALEPTRFRDRYSDHYMVTFEIEVGADDD